MTPRNHRLRLLALAAPGVLLLAGCGTGDNTTPTSQPDELTGRTFVFSDVQVSDTGAPPSMDGDGISVTFTDTGVTATGGCNTMSGDATVVDGELVVTDGLAMTEMACDAQLMDQDAWLAQMLTPKPTLAVANDTITLAANGTVLTLVESSDSATTASLVGPVWTLDALTSNDSVASIPRGVTSNLEFVDGGTVNVQFGCNSGSGSYAVSEDTISFGKMTSTLIGCTGAQADVEAAVGKMLEGDVTYSISGNLLTLTDRTSGLVYRTS